MVKVGWRLVDGERTKCFYNIGYRVECWMCRRMVSIDSVSSVEAVDAVCTVRCTAIDGGCAVHVGHGVFPQPAFLCLSLSSLLSVAFLMNALARAWH